MVREGKYVASRNVQGRIVIECWRGLRGLTMFTLRLKAETARTADCTMAQSRRRVLHGEKIRSILANFQTG